MWESLLLKEEEEEGEGARDKVMKWGGGGRRRKGCQTRHIMALCGNKDPVGTTINIFVFKVDCLSFARMSREV